MSTTDSTRPESTRPSAAARRQSRTADGIDWRTARRRTVRYAARTKTARTARRQLDAVKAKARRWMVLLVLVQVIVYFFSYGTKPGGPFGIEPASCGPGAEGSVEGQSVVVVMAEAQGNALRRLAGPPPDPADTHRVAQEAADAVVVAVLALKAAARGEDDPAKVTEHNARSVERHYRAVADTAAACSPCPTDPSTRGPIPAGVGASSAGAGLARAAAAAAGFTGADLDIAVAVAGAESAYRPDATNTNTNGSLDHGLWQINSVHADVLASGDWSDPFTNARMAHQVWAQAGGSWSPWTTYKTGAYLAHLRTAQAAAAAAVPAVSVDPAACGWLPFASNGQGTAPGAWGGHTNGRIPATAMCSPAFNTAALLRCDAATALDRLNAAYRAEFGTDLVITDSYRSHDAQVRAKAAKGHLAAKPGTSNHGWGLALDLGGGVNRFGTPQHQWMAAHGPVYGWVHPNWARQGGSKPEPWHFEYTGITTTGRSA